MADSELGLFAQMLGRAAYEFSAMQPMLPTYMHLIASALFPIYAGAHASLSRPSTAAKPVKKVKKKKKEERNESQLDSEDETEDDDDDDEERVMEGLSPTDAILMPLFAGIALASLYLLIKWLEDPALLNKLLNAYFAIFGIFSVSRLVTDALDIGHSIIFPRRYVLRGCLYHVHDRQRKAVPVAGTVTDKQPIATPLPGFLARIPLPERVKTALWSDRAMPANKWTLKLHLKRVLAGKFRFGPHDLFGVVVALAVVAYFNLVDKPWYLTNLLGFGFSYGALQLMSPTTFATGSLILGALFFYDIYFVFYTPMMVTVAKSLDVPIKLMFPRPSSVDDPSEGPSHAMLGLGDVVLPGIMIGLALRFDLYLFYLRQQKRIPSATSGKEDTIQKSRYQSLAGRWTDHFWTHSLAGTPLWSPSMVTREDEAPFTFPKTYFRASLVGYVLGLLATLGVMMLWNHAQPALLYLVPGVLGSIWLTALIRGEINLMWEYTEEIEDEEESKGPNNEKDVESTDTRYHQVKPQTDVSSDLNKATDNEAAIDRGEDGRRVKNRRPTREIFSFSIEGPQQLKGAQSVEKSRAYIPPKLAQKEINWAPSETVNQFSGAEPVGKRVKLR